MIGRVDVINQNDTCVNMQENRSQFDIINFLPTSHYTFPHRKSDNLHVVSAISIGYCRTNMLLWSYVRTETGDGSLVRGAREDDN